MKKQATFTVGAIALIIAVAIYIFVYVVPHPQDNLVVAMEIVSIVDPNPNNHDDIVNITVKWRGHDNTTLTSRVLQQPPANGGYDEKYHVNYGDTFILHVSEWHAWLEVRNLNTKQMVRVYANGLIEPANYYELP
ncbi:MAG: hypothetical protein QXU99_05995 [Candidatus Bathyarchaeia archaeon]